MSAQTLRKPRVARAREARRPDPHAELALALLALPEAARDERTQAVARHIAARTPIARNLARDGATPPTRGQRAADAVAKFGGSWTFVGLFAATMVAWVVLNAVLLLARGTTFDPFPYVLLNLFLSMLAAIQAPVLLMSQNRQSQKDRLGAEHDYEVNLKAELEIMLLHDKLDALRHSQWQDLLALQREQLRRLAELGEPRGPLARAD